MIELEFTVTLPPWSISVCMAKGHIYFPIVSYIFVPKLYSHHMMKWDVGIIGRAADLAGGSLLRGGHTQVGEPKIGEHAQ
jgi:hypothetical protein